MTTQKSQAIKNYSKNHSKIFPKSGIKKALSDSYNNLRTSGENDILDEAYSISINQGYSHLTRIKKIKDKINESDLDSTQTLTLNKFLNVYNMEVMNKQDKVKYMDQFKKESNSSYNSLYSGLEQRTNYEEERFVPSNNIGNNSLPVSDNQEQSYVADMVNYARGNSQNEERGLWKRAGKVAKNTLIGLAGAGIIGAGLFGSYHLGKHNEAKVKQSVIDEKQAMLNISNVTVSNLKEDLDKKEVVLSNYEVTLNQTEQESQKQVDKLVKENFELEKKLIVYEPRINEQEKIITELTEKNTTLKTQYENCVNSSDEPKIVLPTIVESPQVEQADTRTIAYNPELEAKRKDTGIKKLSENELIQSTSSYVKNFEAKDFETESATSSAVTLNANWEDRMGSFEGGLESTLEEECLPCSRNERYVKWLMNDRADMYSESGRGWEAGITKVGGVLSNINRAGRWLSKNTLGRVVDTFTKEKGEQSFENTNNFFWRNAPLGPNSNFTYDKILNWGSLGILKFNKKTDPVDPYVCNDGLAGAAVQIGTHWMLWDAIDGGNGGGDDPVGGFNRDGGEVIGTGRGGGVIK